MLGPGDEALYLLEQAKSRVDAQTIPPLFSNISQSIDATVEGYESEGQDPTVTIRAVDSTCFDVESTKRELVDAIARRYRKVYRYERRTPDGDEIPM